MAWNRVETVLSGYGYRVSLVVMLLKHMRSWSNWDSQGSPDDWIGSSEKMRERRATSIALSWVGYGALAVRSVGCVSLSIDQSQLEHLDKDKAFLPIYIVAH